MGQICEGRIRPRNLCQHWKVCVFSLVWSVHCYKSLHSSCYMVQLLLQGSISKRVRDHPATIAARMQPWSVSGPYPFVKCHPSPLQYCCEISYLHAAGLNILLLKSWYSFRLKKSSRVTNFTQPLLWNWYPYIQRAKPHWTDVVPLWWHDFCYS